MVNSKNETKQIQKAIDMMNVQQIFPQMVHFFPFLKINKSIELELNPK